MEINPLELASELAHDRMVMELQDRDIIVYEEDVWNHGVEDLTYKEFAQDEFNIWYDYYITTIEACSEYE